MNEVDILDEDILLPYQKQWVADESPVKVWEKSRRIGASYVEALDSVLNAAKSREAGGQSTYYLSYNKEMTQQFVRDCAFWARHMDLAAKELEETVLKDDDKDITVYRVRFASGYEIWGMPSEPRSLRSKQGRVVIDEAAFVENLPELLKAAMALRMWGGSVRIMSTHNGEDSDFNELIKEIRAGKRPYTLHRVTFDDALEQGLYYRIALTKGWLRTTQAEKNWRAEIIAEYPDGADEELFCIPTRSGTKYFPRALVERAMDRSIPVATYELPDEFTFLADEVRERETTDWITDELAGALTASRLGAVESGRRARGYVGMDFARSGDLSVIAAFLETEHLGLDGVVYTELRNIPFTQQFQIFCYVVDRLPGFSAAAIDARGNGQMIAELAAQKYGQAYVHQVMPSRSFYLDYMPKYKAKFEDDAIRIPKHDGILDDHRTVVMDKGIPVVAERTRDAAGKQRHGDAVIAGVMAVYAQVNDEDTYQPYQYEPVRATNQWRHDDDDDW